jgi:hypothetical protein
MLGLKGETRRRGFINSLELIFLLPIVIIMLIVIVQFSQVLAIEARLASASRQGARVAASGGNTRQIRHAVHSALHPRDRELVTIETNAVGSDGNPLNSPPGCDVVVRVSMPTQEVVPGALLMVLANNRVLVGQTVMRKE